MPAASSRPPSRARLARRLAAVALGLLAAASGGYYLYVRHLRQNFHAVVPGKVYRSAQPAAGHLRRWRDEYGLRSVINLRGESDEDFHAAERNAAGELDLELIDVRLSAVRQPSRPAVAELIDALETAPQPMLIHCRDGADRTGVASVLAAMAIGGQTYADARGQLSIWTLHVDTDPEHVGGLLDAYESYCRQRGLDTAGWAQFSRWAREHYAAYYYLVRIDAPRELRAAPGERVDAALTLRNRSGRPIPAGDPGKLFTTAAFLGSAVNEEPERELAPRVALPRKDIPPGGSACVRMSVLAPREPGEYELHFDCIEEGRTWFARQGSPVATCRLIVAAPSTGRERAVEAGAGG